MPVDSFSEMGVLHVSRQIILLCTYYTTRVMDIYWSWRDTRIMTGILELKRSTGSSPPLRTVDITEKGIDESTTVSHLLPLHLAGPGSLFRLPSRRHPVRVTTATSPDPVRITWIQYHRSGT